eukprot:TRINITY_DN2849_c0_g1_i5.p3 TRINITY_DN2849_c0_g1~~TRINITY_DN2849_c0_g1_i5.p3  ORF type:complete len:144 (-),score=59.34 TRINITY_DN2849_c0_g1_i5:68-499(-)
MVEVSAKKFVVIVDDTKLVPGLGISGAMPVEVTPFCVDFTVARLLELGSIAGCTAKVRDDGGKPYVTDNDNYIVDLYFTEPIADAVKAGEEINALVGVVEHGLVPRDDQRGDCGGRRRRQGHQAVKRPRGCVRSFPFFFSLPV